MLVAHAQLFQYPFSAEKFQIKLKTIRRIVQISQETRFFNKIFKPFCIAQYIVSYFTHSMKQTKST